MSGAKSWPDLIRNVEETDILFSSSPDDAAIERASALWNALLFKSPRVTVSRTGKLV